MKLVVYLIALFIACTFGKSLHRSQTLSKENAEDCSLGDRRRYLKVKRNIQKRYWREVPNTIYVNGHVYTVDGADWHRYPQQALVVRKGKIIFIGSNSEAKQYFKCKSIVLDLKGNTVLPGFHDVHIHPLESGSPVGGTCKLPRDTDPEEMLNIFKTCKTRQKGTKWILGGGHSIINMLDHIRRNNSRSPRKILDEAIPNEPAIMMEETSHSVWVNSKALEMANITKDTPKRPGGVIMREKNSNEPNGILFEDEGIAIMEYAMKPTRELEHYNYDGLMDSLAYLNKLGITSLCDARLFWTRNHGKVWDDMCYNNKLTVRAVLDLWAYPQKNDDDQIKKLKEMYTIGNRKCFLKKTQIKLYMDGLLGTTTAAVNEPYKINFHLPGIPDNRGMNIFTEERLTKYVRALQSFDNHRKGFDFHVHAIGDRGIHQALNAFEKAHMRGTRHRLTHLELVDQKDIPRFKDLNVIADFQVAGNFSLPSEKDYVIDTIGKERAVNYIPVRSIVSTGAKATLSSDWDVSTPNPFIGIQHAISRGHQSVDVKTAIEMYTNNAAYVMRQEDTVGSLVFGKDADFIVIDKDILDYRNKHAIRDTKVLQTVLAGDEVYWKKSNNIKDETCNSLHDYLHLYPRRWDRYRSCRKLGRQCSYYHYRQW